MQSAGEDAVLRALSTTVCDLMKSFQQLERSFLKPEYQKPLTNIRSSVSPSYIKKSGYYTDDSDENDSVSGLKYEPSAGLYKLVFKSYGALTSQ
jgi:hypothetical protein